MEIKELKKEQNKKAQHTLISKLQNQRIKVTQTGLGAMIERTVYGTFNSIYKSANPLKLRV